MGFLRFPVFLLVLLNITVVQITAVINMSMFPEVPDFSFSNCRDKMLAMVTKPGGLLETELNKSTAFRSMWQAACKKTISGGRKEHMTALQSFVADDIFPKNFYKALTESSGDEFPFKSLFFLLTDATNLLKSSNICRTVYYGTEKEYDAKIGEKVRFKSIYPGHLTYSDATEIAGSNQNIGTVFNIKSCSVIILDDYDCETEEVIDLLIYPTEIFTVNNITTVKNRNNHYKEITLIHSHFHSSSDCTAFDSHKSDETKEPPKNEKTTESSSSFLSSSSLNLVASLLTVYLCTLAL